MDYESLIDAASLVGNTNDTVKLLRLKDLEENRKYYITVWGHYSAGKSKLINNIFGKDILPVQSRETTAVLTYIQYGTQDACIIFYDNGTASNCDLSVLKSIFQNTKEEYDVAKMDHVEVYLNSELLKSGLVLVDTPGANTIIQKHQDLAADAIEQSGRIIYVLGNSPTNVDRQFIKQISDCGIRIDFVRTKCDKFVSSEENPKLSLKKEQDELESFLGSGIKLIAVSNESTSEWFNNIKDVRILLQSISNDIVSEMKEATANRMRIYAEKYVAVLKDETERISDIIEGDVQKYNDKIEQYEKEIQRIESISDEIEQRVEGKVKNAHKMSEREIDQLITKRIDDFSKAIERVEDHPGISDEIHDIYLRHLSLTVSKIQEILKAYFDVIIKDEASEIFVDYTEEDIDIPVPAYSELQQENFRIIEMYSARLAEVKNRIESILREKAETEQTLEELEAEFDEDAYASALQLLEQKLKEIPSGTPLCLSENQGIQPSSVFKTIGNAADLALLLLPGDVIFAGVKAAANTTKIAQTLHKMGKAGEVIIKAGSTVGKNAKVIDTVRDTAYALNSVMGKRGYSTMAEKAAAKKLVDKAAKTASTAYETYKADKREGNVLDALSVAYWTEKFGKQFDSEPRMEVDIEEQERRRLLRKQITEEQQQISNERMQKKRELGLLQDREKELSALAQEEELRQKRIEAELQKQEELLVTQARETAFRKYCKDYSLYYANAVTHIADTISKQYFQSANQNITMYAATQTTSLKNDIENKKEQIEALLNLRDTGKDEIMLRLEKCKLLLNELEMCN